MSGTTSPGRNLQFRIIAGLISASLSWWAPACIIYSWLSGIVKMNPAHGGMRIVQAA